MSSGNNEPLLPMEDPIEDDLARNSTLMRPSSNRATITRGSDDDQGHDDNNETNDWRSSRPSVKDCLNLPDEELADLSLDVYNMFFLSDMFSPGFFYSIAALVTKMSLYVFLIVDLRGKCFPFERKEDSKCEKDPDEEGQSPIIKIAQLFLIPVAIMMQEELQTSFFIFGNLKYSDEILVRHPGAYRWKYYFAHIARFVDGGLFLFINTVVMLQSEEVLSCFLNFAALMFLQSIDNVALQVCLDGYWTQSLQDAAKDVVEMKFAYRHEYLHHCMQTTFFLAMYVGMVSLWVRVHYIQ